MNYLLSFLSVLLFFMSCMKTEPPVDKMPVERSYSYLALGDSYTYGQNVERDSIFPAQLISAIDSLEDKSGSLTMIAQTGWTTTDLINNMTITELEESYDFATLLIGVNNQYQNKNFERYEDEFPALVNTALSYVDGDTDRLIIVSIPDYAFTPFGQNSGNSEKISEELDVYNAYAEEYAMDNSITFVNITDITRKGVEDPMLVASDNLHPSAKAYSMFVERLLPIALKILE